MKLHDEHAVILNTIWKKYNWDLWDRTYHNNLPKEVVQRMQLMNDPTSLELRGTSDGAAIGKKSTIKYEVKVRDVSKDYQRDMFIEAGPYLNHLATGLGGSVCYYFCKNLLHKYEFAFKVGGPKIQGLYTTVKSEDENIRIKTMCKKLAPEIEVYGNVRNMGSEDPYLLIESSQFFNLYEGWESVVSRLTREDR
jgi:hypothetical protein